MIFLFLLQTSTQMIQLSVSICLYFVTDVKETLNTCFIVLYVNHR